MWGDTEVFTMKSVAIYGGLTVLAALAFTLGPEGSFTRAALIAFLALAGIFILRTLMYLIRGR